MYKEVPLGIPPDPRADHCAHFIPNSFLLVIYGGRDIKKYDSTGKSNSRRQVHFGKHPCIGTDPFGLVFSKAKQEPFNREIFFCLVRCWYDNLSETQKFTSLEGLEMTTLWKLLWTFSRLKRGTCRWLLK